MASRTKLLDLGPTWGPFRGWSVLYSDHDPSVVDFYDQLAFWFDDQLDSRSDGHGVAALPRSTFHVTVCDGISDGLVDRVGSRDRPRVLAVLERIESDSLDGGHVDALAPFAGPEVDDLLRVARAPLRFRIAAIRARGRAVVADLATDPDDQPVRAAIERRRRTLLAQLGSHLDLDLITPWRPHVTLAYALEPARANRFVDHTAQAAHELVRQREERCATFDAAEVFLFDDMVHFRRLGDTLR